MRRLGPPAGDAIRQGELVRMQSPGGGPVPSVRHLAVAGEFEVDRRRCRPALGRVRAPTGRIGSRGSGGLHEREHVIEAARIARPPPTSAHSLPNTPSRSSATAALRVSQSAPRPLVGAVARSSRKAGLAAAARTWSRLPSGAGGTVCSMSPTSHSMAWNEPLVEGKAHHYLLAADLGMQVAAHGWDACLVVGEIGFADMAVVGPQHGLGLGPSSSSSARTFRAMATSREKPGLICDTASRRRALDAEPPRSCARAASRSRYLPATQASPSFPKVSRMRSIAASAASGS